MGNAALSLGLSWAELAEMSWGRVVIMLQANAQSYKEAKAPKKGTDAQIFAWAGR